MTNFSSVFKKTLAGFVAEFYLNLISFVKFVEEGDKNLSPKDFEKIRTSEHPLIVLFRNKDLPRFNSILSNFDTVDLSRRDIEAISKWFEHLISCLRSLDFDDNESSWSFFESGLDILLKDLESVLQPATYTALITWTPSNKYYFIEDKPKGFASIFHRTPVAHSLYENA